jgi:HEAT repeat protein
LAALIHYGTGYRYEKSHAPAWRALAMDEKADMYGRLCAAQFLLDDDDDARKFIEKEVRAQNLRHRYNAAEALRWYVGRDPAKAWGVRLMISLLEDRSLDGSGIESSPSDYKGFDRDDIMFTPINTYCWDLGFMKEHAAVDALISVLERKPNIDGAAFALGEIGDRKAIPVLMKILKDNSGYEHREVTSLGQLKCKEALPILIARLPTAGHGQLEQQILEALADIGDKSAVPAIKSYLQTCDSRVARRVLARLDSTDPVADLLGQLEKETYEPARSDIISDLVRYKDPRVVEPFTKLARHSDSAFMRREAIFGLRAVATRQSLLELAALLDVKFPKNLKIEWGWKYPPDELEPFFRELITDCLKDYSKQDFGTNSRKWISWINENVK